MNNHKDSSCNLENICTSCVLVSLHEAKLSASSGFTCISGFRSRGGKYISNPIHVVNTCRERHFPGRGVKALPTPLPPASSIHNK